VAELADALDLGSSGLNHRGSSPLSRILSIIKDILSTPCYFFVIPNVKCKHSVSSTTCVNFALSVVNRVFGNALLLWLFSRDELQPRPMRGVILRGLSSEILIGTCRSTLPFSHHSVRGFKSLSLRHIFKAKSQKKLGGSLRVDLNPIINLLGRNRPDISISGPPL
jgi:hypothetical protein